MLDAADILVDRQPIARRVESHRAVCLGTGEAYEIPRRFYEGVERVGLPHRVFSASRAGHMLPCRVMIERVARRIEDDVLGQYDGKLIVRHGNGPTVRAIDDGNRAAPIALAGNPPIAQAIGDGDLAGAARGHAVGDRPLGVVDGHAVEELGVDRPAVAQIGLVGYGEAARIHIGGGDHRDHVEAVFAGKIEIALIMARTAENRPGAIVHEHEIGHIDGQIAALDEGMLGFQRYQKALLLGPLDGFLAGPHAVALGDEGGQGGIDGGELLGQRVMGRYRAESGAENRIVAGGEDLETVVPVAALVGQIEPHAQTFGAPDPVVLHEPHPVGPALQPREAVEQVVGIGGDAQHPLGQLALLHHRARAPAAPVDDLFIGQNGVVDGIPVDP